MKHHGSGTKFLKTLLGTVLGMAVANPVHAQSLYQPYYYSTQDMYRAESNAPSSIQSSPSYYSATQPNYISDPGLPQQAYVQQPSSYAVQTQPVSPQPVNPQPVATTLQPQTTSSSSELSLATRSGMDFGVEGYSQRYNSHTSDDGLRIQGARAGVVGAVTGNFGSQNDYFTTLEGEYDWGDMRSSGADDGQKNNIPDDAWEARWLVGRDFNWSDHVDTSPYLGVSYGSWFLNATGKTSDGSPINQIESRYLTVPVGLTERLRVGENSRLSLNGEFDYFVHERVTSYFSKILAGDPDPSLEFYHGYGARGFLSYEEGNWSFGPFVRYLNLERSASKTFSNTSAHVAETYYNPGTNFLEIGAQLKYHFGLF